MPGVAERLDPAPHLALLHGTTAGSEPVNLRAIATLRSKFGIPVGWSDSGSDSRADVDLAPAAVALGAAIVETPADRLGLHDYLVRIRSTHAALGDGRLPTRTAD